LRVESHALILDWLDQDTLEVFAKFVAWPWLRSEEKYKKSEVYIYFPSKRLVQKRIFTAVPNRPISSGEFLVGELNTPK
jgi:hypothetical protein